MKLKTSIGLLALAAVIYCLYISFGMNPDWVVWNDHGYLFGFNWSTHVIEKMIAVLLIVTYGFLATAKEA